MESLCNCPLTDELAPNAAGAVLSPTGDSVAVAEQSKPHQNKLANVVRGLRIKSGISRDALPQRVLVDLSILHDEDEVLDRVLDELDVLDWVAVDEKQVGERAFFDDTELAGVRIALPG